MSKVTKYKELCRAASIPFLPVFFESQGSVGLQLLEHFDKVIVWRADELGAPVAPLMIYWSRRLSVTPRHSVAQAIKIKMATLYTGPSGPTAVDKITLPGVIDEQVQTSVGIPHLEL